MTHRIWAAAGVVTGGFVASLLLGPGPSGAPPLGPRSAEAAGDATVVQEAWPGVVFDSPVCVAAPDDGTDRVFVAQRSGKVMLLKKWRGAGPVAPAKTFLDISALQNTAAIEEGQGGLLTIAFHPDYKANGRFFVFYGAGSPHKTVVAGYRASANDPDKADPASGKVILSVDKPSLSHYGGGLAFGPDGKLYAAIGAPENMVEADKPKPTDYYAQDMSRLDGKIVRLDVDGAPPYAVPDDNPWAASGKGVRGEIWAYGCRNPWRISFDKEKGTMWLGDPGQRRREEVDVVPRAGNMGWAFREGSLPLMTGAAPADVVAPVFDYGRETGNCVIGGVVYHGQRCTAWRGNYVFGEFGKGKILALPTDGSKVTGAVKEIGVVASVCSVDADAQGELYFCALDSGKVFTLAPAP